MLRDPDITFQKNVDHFYRSVARLLVQRVKSHKLTSNACQVTFFVQISCNRILMSYTNCM